MELMFCFSLSLYPPDVHSEGVCGQCRVGIARTCGTLQIWSDAPASCICHCDAFACHVLCRVPSAQCFGHDYYYLSSLLFLHWIQDYWAIGLDTCCSVRIGLTIPSWLSACVSASALWMCVPLFPVIHFASLPMLPLCALLKVAFVLMFILSFLFLIRWRCE